MVGRPNSNKRLDRIEADLRRKRKLLDETTLLLAEPSLDEVSAYLDPKKPSAKQVRRYLLLDRKFQLDKAIAEAEKEKHELEGPLKARRNPKLPKTEPLRTVVLLYSKPKTQKLSQREVCGQLDSMNIAVPEEWRRIERSWCGALANLTLNGRVKKFLSSAKRTAMQIS